MIGMEKQEADKQLDSKNTDDNDNESDDVENISPTTLTMSCCLMKRHQALRGALS